MELFFPVAAFVCMALLVGFFLYLMATDEAAIHPRSTSTDRVVCPYCQESQSGWEYGPGLQTCERCFGTFDLQVQYRSTPLEKGR